MSKLLQMPHRCAEAMWTEYELRSAYRRELEREEQMKWRAIRNGFIGAGALFLLCFGLYWLVRIAT